MQPFPQAKIIHPNQSIKGLSYIKNLITKQEEIDLVNHIVKSDWNTSLKRRTQHYGFEYIYDRKNTLSPAPQIPEWAQGVKKRIQEILNLQLSQTKTLQKGEKTQIHFDQLIINEYQPGQGINPHIDNPILFGSPIVSLSLGSNCIMEFDHPKQGDDCIEVLLERRSVFILDKEARYEWKHSIPGRKKDNGNMRNFRYSLTFRTTKNEQIKNENSNDQ